jgi:glycosyltransferase involved in cell wall biosynthesis
MKIALDVSQTCTENAGCGWIAHQLAKAMAEKACQNREIVLYHHFGYWINEDSKDGFQSQQAFVSSPLLATPPEEARNLWNHIGTHGSLLPGKPDIVHSHNFSAPETGQVPLVYTVHDLAFWDMPETNTETNRLLCEDGILEAIKNASAFVFPSQFTKSRFMDFFEDILRSKKQHNLVVPWAGRFPLATKSKSYSTNSPWLFVGSLDPRKNIHNMLQAFERYWDKSELKRNLMIAGPKGWKNNIETAHIESLSKRGCAKHVGYLPDAELRQLYTDSFALVWPSFYEGFGLPIVEAMSQGTPVITSNRTSMPKVGGAAAIYCDPESVESISDAMLSLENNEHQYAAFSKDSLQQSSNFSWEISAGKLFDFYEKVISSK